ncbi:hypothetical protein O181_046007 [Austropuccinia psidii MF-1]|uniref:Integrase catalytic domain-containing protein n=1 Tax=Austropuccinia psidii MF-1 TaxID=1389203 RepID=A0A9Q3HJA0_9BASI|nr:hypothetical protein [Austropuccinia psidii MF-1]
MPVQHSPPAKDTRSQRHQAFLTPTARAPLECTPAVHQLSTNLDRGPPMEGAASSRRGEVDQGESEETEVEAALAGSPEASKAPNLAHYNQPPVSQAEPNFLKIMEQMTQFMGQLTQAVSPRDTSKAPEFKTPSMKAPDLFDGTKAYKAGKWIEPYFSNISNEDPSYLLNNWKLFETQLFTLFGDPNEVRKAEKESENLRMKESGQVSLYIADFRSLMSIIGDLGEKAYIHVYRRGLASILLDQLASHPGNFDSFQELMEINLELDTRYHKRQKEKGSHQEKKPPISGSNSSKPPQSSSSKKPYHRKYKKRKKFQASKDKPHAALLTQDNKLIGSEKERSIKEGLCNYCGGKHPFEKWSKRPQNRHALSQFQTLKEAFTTAPIPSHFNPSLPTIVETDASDYALSAVMSQVNDSGKHPISFDSCKLLPAGLKHEIHDKEPLGIVWALKCCRAFLLSLSDSFEVLTDNSSLQYFMSSKVLTHCPARWAEFLFEFHFSITYHPGRLATLPDALSCWDNVYLERGVDFISKNPQNVHQALKQNEIEESRFFLIKVEVFSDLVDQIQKAVWQDKDYKEVLKQLARGESVSDYTLELKAKLLLFKDRVVIPRNHELQLDILQKGHDSPLAGHPGQEKTLKLMKRAFYWAGMNQIIKDYVSSCQQCSRNKNIHHKKFGLLKPLQIPSGPWNSLSMEFITKLPLSSSFDSILVVVDSFSKMPIFIPTYSTITALELAQIFISHVFSKHGLPISIFSDRGSLFVPSFCTQLCQQLKISRDLSTASHHETDGQTERVNQIPEQYLCMYVSYHQDDWHTWLPLAEFSSNNAEHSSTKQLPFFTIYGRNPSFDSTHISQDTPAGKLSRNLQSVQQVVKEGLESEIKHFKKYADRNREIPPDFQPGDKVWLASKNIKTTRPTKKFSEGWLGPR